MPLLSASVWYNAKAGCGIKMLSDGFANAEIARSNAPLHPDVMTTSSALMTAPGVELQAATARRASIVPAEWMYLCVQQVRTAEQQVAEWVAGCI